MQPGLEGGAMSTADVKREIAKFLAGREAEVICIRGNWGTGKTFSWNAALRGNIAHMSRDNYAYVSLFGLNSVDDIKQEIFQDTIPKDRIGKPFDIENVKTSWRSGLGYLKQAGTLFTQWLGDDYKVIGLSVASLLVRNQIVCFDDLERKGEGLRSADVLGYISQLKEERNCKVVLLLNDEQL
jgi:Cdc6-like AAA superfamily ATPase